MGLSYLGLQLFNGLVSGAFYALLSLGLAIIFGMMRIVNFAHGAMYMLGAFGAYLAAKWLGIAVLGGPCCSCRSSSALFGMLMRADAASGA